MAPKILILDDHMLFCQGIERILLEQFNSEIDIINNPKEVILNEVNNYDIVLVDMDMPGQKGYDFVSTVKETGNKTTKFLIVSMHNKPSLVKKSIESGVNGYILKDDPLEVFTEAITAILEGGEFYSERVEESMKYLTLETIILSPREEQILKYIAKGLNANDIAEMLYISVETVKTHNRNIKSKLKIENRAELIKYAYKNLLT
ncbi:LuxR C-terminal-related transcriptional regulator [Flammeovirga aprica]|uniref:Response regulator transcription factor n=1 Tax=Flammeovirga aprica JL-4 TaxID=694437 RepID=A0A7X9P328_9BACT|nr:response regulator transcription factor [Flammeovirga aprica]NME68435.1 response regulator transcription factor [Flammeovirga aprica JL-4]